jgi:hypothetical protein
MPIHCETLRAVVFLQHYSVTIMLFVPSKTKEPCHSLFPPPSPNPHPILFASIGRMGFRPHSRFEPSAKSVHALPAKVKQSWELPTAGDSKCSNPECTSWQTFKPSVITPFKPTGKTGTILAFTHGISSVLSPPHTPFHPNNSANWRKKPLLNITQKTCNAQLFHNSNQRGCTPNPEFNRVCFRIGLYCIIHIR